MVLEVNLIKQIQVCRKKDSANLDIQRALLIQQQMERTHTQFIEGKIPANLCRLENNF